MNVGVVFPHAVLSDRAAIVEFAQAAEQLGFSHLQVFDHVLGAEHERRDPALAGPYDLDDPFHEPLTLFAFLAGITRRLEFCTGVLILPQRQTALVAKQVTQVAIFAPGRVRLGVGVGWNHVEFQSLGVEFRDRGRRQEDQIAVLRQLWADDLVDHESRWHRLDRVSILPRPSEPIPIWLGGFSPVAHDRAARLADGFIFARTAAETASGSLETQLRRADEIRQKVQGQGRDPGTFGFEGRLNYNDAPAVWTAQYAEMARSGFSHASFNFMAQAVAGQPLNERGVSAQIGVLSVISAELGLA